MTQSRAEERSSKLVEILLGDVSLALSRQREGDDQAARRDLIRTIFAAIDGISWLYRQHVTEVASDMDMLRPEEAQVLSEISYSVSDAGKITTQPRYLPVLTPIRLASRLAQRADPALVIDFAGTNWLKFRASTALRHRITHPKAVADMNIEVSEVRDCLGGFYWLIETIADAMAASNEAFRQHVSGLRKLMRELERGDPRAWAEYRAAQATDNGL